MKDKTIVLPSKDSINDDEWKLYACFQLYRVLEQYEKSWNMEGFIYSLINRETIAFFSFGYWYNNKTEWDLYKYFFHIAKQANIKIKAVIDEAVCDTPYHPIEFFWYTQDEIFKRWYNEAEKWSIIFDKIIPEKFFDHYDFPILGISPILEWENFTESKKKILEHIDMYLGKYTNPKWYEDLKMSYKKQRNIMFEKILNFYEFSDLDEMTLHSKIFSRHEGFSLTFNAILFWRLGYIEINDNHLGDFLEENIELYFEHNWKEKENCIFPIRLEEKFKVILLWFWEIKNLIMDKIFDEEYKKISILKKWWNLYMLHWEKEIDGDNIRFIELQKQYPYSEISAKNHNGKLIKYEVKEKIKLVKSKQE